jgi:hypothetical protein
MKGIIEIVNISDNELLCMAKSKYHYFEHASEDFESFCKNNLILSTNETYAMLLYKEKKVAANLINYKMISPGYASKLINYFK